MLTEERHEIILKYLQEHKRATVAELNSILNTSESTVRRDLAALHREGKLTKVHGGATLVENSYVTWEDDVSTRSDMYITEKTTIARRAAQIIQPNDFVYIDAGTTTAQMLDFIQEKNATYVTNGISHAVKHLSRGFTAYIIGGRLKGVTEAVTGTEAIRSLTDYNFTKGFFGTNGISTSAGFTTAEFGEANVKREAMRHCREAFVLADSSKFNKIFPVTFSMLDKATILTDKLQDIEYIKYTKVIEVNEAL